MFKPAGFINDEYYIKKALELAKKSLENDEIPIGALIVDQNNNIIGTGYNSAEQKKNQLFHAEIIAIQEATKQKNDWRLDECILYVTLEPCMMCFGLIHLSRIKKLIYAANSHLFTVKSLYNKPYANHTCIIEKGPGEKESSDLLKTFFKKIRD